MSIERFVQGICQLMLLGCLGCVVFTFGIAGWGYLSAGWPQLDEANPSPIPYIILLYLFSALILLRSNNRQVVVVFSLIPVFFGLLYIIPDGQWFKMLNPSIRADGRTYTFTPEETGAYTFCLLFTEDQHKNLITKYKRFYMVRGQIEIVEKNSNSLVSRAIAPIVKDHQLDLDQRAAPAGLDPGPLTMALLTDARLKKGRSYEIRALIGQETIDALDGKTKTVGPVFPWPSVPAPRLALAYDWSPGGLVKIKWPAALSNKGWLTVGLFLLYAAFVQIVFYLPKLYRKFSAKIKGWRP